MLLHHLNQDIIDMTSTFYAAERQVNRKMLIKILSNIRYLARQSLAYRGSWDEEDGAEVNSNLYQLLMLRAEEDPNVLEWIQTKQYMSPRIQNEMIEALGLGADISNKEHVVVCIRWVDEKLISHKDFIESTLLTKPLQKKLLKSLKTL